VGNAGQVLALTTLSALAQGINFIFRVAMARMVGAEVMGLYQLVMSAYAVIQAVTTNGLSAAMSNLTARHLATGDARGARRLRRDCLKIFVCLMLPVGSVTVLCSDAVSVHLLGDARTQLGLILLIPCLALTAVENLHKNAFYGAGKPLPPAVAEVWEQLVRAGAVLGLLWLFLPQYPERAVGLVLWGMILCEVSSAVTLVTLYQHIFVRPSRHDEGERPEALSARLALIASVAVPVGANALLGNLLGAATSALLPRELVRGGLERGEAISRLGVVSGMTLPMLALPTVWLGALNLVLMPKLTRAHTLGEKGELRGLISHGMGTACALAIPSMTAMAVLGEDLGRLLYGREDVGTCLVPLALAMGINCCVSVLANAMNAIGKQKTVALVSLAGGSLQVLCTLALTARAGLAGYAAGVVLCAALELALCLKSVKNTVGLSLSWKKWLLVPSLCSAAAGLVGRLFCLRLRGAGAGELRCAAAGVALMTGVYLLCRWMLGKRCAK